LQWKLGQNNQQINQIQNLPSEQESWTFVDSQERTWIGTI